MTEITPLPRNHGSQAVETALDELGLPSDSDLVRFSRHQCQGAKFHSPRPLVVRSYETYDGGVIHLCPVCRDNIDMYDYLIGCYKGDLPWPVRREFGNVLREAARRLLGENVEEAVGS
jgi:hypothetical protein